MLMRSVLAFLLFLSLAAPARAHLVVDGTVENLNVEATDELLSDIFKVLSIKLGVHVKSPLPLDTYRSGKFMGSLKTVIRRLLEGYDFVTVSRQEDAKYFTDVIVIGRSREAPMGSPLLPKQQAASPRFDGFK
jgi:hypothetical protein